MVNLELRLKELKAKANKLPQTPGVYIMKDKSGTIIYIGKAKSLKNRVTQYFGKGTNHTAKVQRMVELVNDFEYILCDSEYEAFTAYAKEYPDPELLCQSLMRKALNRGAKDNVTVLAVMK